MNNLAGAFEAVSLNQIRVDALQKKLSEKVACEEKLKSEVNKWKQDYVNLKAQITKANKVIAKQE